MSSDTIKLCSLLLKEYFGDIVQKVGGLLLKQGALPLLQIQQMTKLDINKVRRSLKGLVRHSIVTFTRDKRGQFTYTIDINAVLAIMLYPKFIYFTKTLFGNYAEMIIEEFFDCGEMSKETVVNKIVKNLQVIQQQNPDDANVDKSSSSERLAKATSAFDELAKVCFLVKCPTIDELFEGQTNSSKQQGESKGAAANEDAGSKRKREAGDHAANPAKKAKKEEVLYWKINRERFHLFYRDQLIISAVKSKIGQQPGEIMRCLLRVNELNPEQWKDTSNHITFNDLSRMTSKQAETKIPGRELELLLNMMSEGAIPFIRKVGETGGGLYVICFKEIMGALASANMESMILEKFGPKYLRIFRLIRARNYIEQEEIKSKSMLAPKNAVEMTYTLLNEGFISVKEVSKTPENVPFRTFYLFFVNMSLVNQNISRHCYKAMSNLLQRTHHEYHENRRVLDKFDKREILIKTVTSQGATEEQLEEIQEMMTEAEEAQVEQVKKKIAQINRAELQLSETLFTLYLYTKYTTVPPPPKKTRRGAAL